MSNSPRTFHFPPRSSVHSPAATQSKSISSIVYAQALPPYDPPAVSLHFCVTAAHPPEASLSCCFSPRRAVPCFSRICGVSRLIPANMTTEEKMQLVDCQCSLPLSFVGPLVQKSMGSQHFSDVAFSPLSKHFCRCCVVLLGGTPMENMIYFESLTLYIQRA